MEHVLQELKRRKYRSLKTIYGSGSSKTKQQNSWLVNKVKSNETLFNNIDVIQDILYLTQQLLDKDASIQNKFKAGKPVFTKAVVLGIKALLMAKGYYNQLTAFIVDSIVSTLAEKVYDWISDKIINRIQGKGIYILLDGKIYELIPEYYRLLIKQYFNELQNQLNSL